MGGTFGVLVLTVWVGTFGVSQRTFGDFSTSHFTSPALSPDDAPLEKLRIIRTKQTHHFDSVINYDKL